MTTFTAGQVLTAAGLNQAVVPTGGLLPYAGSSAPAGFLLCDGSAVSRSTYADLFAVLSTTYGAGNGTTTFNVPDLRQKFPMGKAASGTGSTLGSTGGSKDAVSVSHSHSATSGGQSVTHTHGAGGSGWFMTTDNSSLITLTGGGGDARQIQIVSSTQNASVGHTHTVSVGPDGSSATDANLPAYQVFNYLIKT